MGGQLRIVVQSCVSTEGWLNWKIDIYMNGNLFAENIHIVDPFNEDDEEECRWYIEDYLRESPFEQSRADAVVESLDYYGQNLFDQLQLDRLFTSLIYKDNLRDQDLLNIDVEERLIADPAHTIHRLHWETLEWPKLWAELGLQVVVRRLLPAFNAGISSIKRLDSWSRGIPVLQILLVVARYMDRNEPNSHLGSNQSQYGDADTDQVYRSLKAIKFDLEGRRASFRINIEIVRPGTFSALKKHLEEKSTKHPNGYFHIVHFDLHGRIGLTSKDRLKTAFLDFSSALRPGKLAPQRARSVAKLLNQHRIRIAVLSSCESAKANKGSEANLARTFGEEGIQNILAMSYKNGQSTVSEFTRCFYNSLIADGKPFSVAVRDARAYLRTSSHRDARYKLRKSLQDWIVPVVYASGKDSQIRFSAPPLLASPYEMPMTALSVADNPAIADLIGRGFDILRFEKELWESKFVALSGPAGIGKTLFIQTLLDRWTISGGFQQTVYVDCMSPKFSLDLASEMSLLQIILRENQLEKENIPTDNEVASLWYKSAVERLRSTSTVLALDHLDTSHSDMPERSVKGIWSKLSRNTLRKVIEDLVSDQPEGIPVSIILIGRHEEQRWWKETFHEYPRFHQYSLGPLKLADAISMSQNFLQESGVNTALWDKEECEVLTQVLKLIQCNPLAIEVVLRSSEITTVPWKDFFETLLFHKISPSLGIRSTFVERDLSLIRSLSKETVQILSTLTLYWTQGGCILKELPGATVGTAENISTAITTGVDRGFFSLDAQGYLDWIHPLFIVYARAYYTCEATQASPTFISESLEWTIGFNQDNHVKPPGLFQFLDSFFEGLHNRVNDWGVSLLAGGCNLALLETSVGPAFYNVLTGLRTCSLKHTSLALDYLPLSLVLYGFAAMWFLNPYEISLLARYSENVLQRFIRGRKDLSDTSHDRVFELLGSFLVLLHLNNPALPGERAKEFAKLAVDIMAATEKARGVNPAMDISKNVCSALLGVQYPPQAIIVSDFDEAQTTLLPKPAVEDGKQRREFDIPDIYERAAFLLPDDPHVASRVQHLYSKEFQDSLAEGIGSSPVGIKAIEAIYSLSKEKNNHELGLISQIMTDDQNPLEWLTLKASPLGYDPNEIFFKPFHGKGTIGERAAIANRPDSKRNFLEHTLSVGDWVEASKGAEGLLQRALEDWRMDEATEMLDLLVTIYGKSPDFSANLVRLQARRGVIERFSTSLGVILACGQDINMTLETYLEHTDNFVKLGCELGIGEIPADYTEIAKVDFARRFSTIMPADFSFDDERPKRQKYLLLKDMAQISRDPDMRERFLTFKSEFPKLTISFTEAIKTEDFDTAITCFDKMRQLDNLEIMPSFSRSYPDATRELLVSCRDWDIVRDSIVQVWQQEGLRSAGPMMRALADRYENGDFPGIPEHFVEFHYLFVDLWTLFPKLEAVLEAIDLGNLAEAFAGIASMRATTASKTSSTKMFAGGTMSTVEVIDCAYLMILHRHLAISQRWKSALKVQNHLLSNYEEFIADDWRTQANLDEELNLKWEYEFRQKFAESQPCFESQSLEDLLSCLESMELLYSNLPQQVPGDLYVRIEPLKTSLSLLRYSKSLFVYAQSLNDQAIDGNTPNKQAFGWREWRCLFRKRNFDDVICLTT